MAQLSCEHGFGRLAEAQINAETGKTENKKTEILGNILVIDFCCMGLTNDELEDKGSMFSISDLDQLRGKKAGGDTPVFLDDGCLKKLKEAFLKHFFGVPGVPQEQMLMVRYEHATLTHDCPRAAADNPVDQEEAAKIKPEDMTVEKLIQLCRRCWAPDIDQEDLAAVLRRISMMVFCKAPHDRVVVYVTLPDRRYAAGRDLTWFYLEACS